MDRLTTLAEAVRLVHSGETLALGGMTIYRRPVAFVVELLRRSAPPRDLTLLSFTAGLAADLLVGAGLISHTRTCYFGLETFGLAPMFSRAVREGTLQVIEESEASIACGLRAALAGVGFIPSRAWQGTDMLKVRSDVTTIEDPYSGQPLTAFPAIHCDVSVIHVLRADRAGNALLGGNPTVDLELAMVSDRVILTAETVVDELQETIDLPALDVTSVVHLPGGAWPTSCYPAYALDGEAILAYIDACNQDRFWDYLGSLHDAPGSDVGLRHSQ